MQKSEDKFRAMVGTIPALVWCTLPDGSNEFHNQRWHDYTGLPEGAETGWGWKVAYHPEDIERLLNEFQSIVASGRRVRWKRVCGVSMGNIDGFASARSPFATRQALSSTGMAAVPTLKTANVRKRNCGRMSASFAG